MNGREALSRVLAIASEALDEAGGRQVWGYVDHKYTVLHGKDSLTTDEYPFAGDEDSAKEQYEHDSKCLAAAANIVWRIEADEEY